MLVVAGMHTDFPKARLILPPKGCRSGITPVLSYCTQPPGVQREEVVTRDAEMVLRRTRLAQLTRGTRYSVLRGLARAQAGALICGTTGNDAVRKRVSSCIHVQPNIIMLRWPGRGGTWDLRAGGS